MTVDLWVAAAVMAAAVLLALEVRERWRPVPRAGSLRRRLSPAKDRPRRRVQRHHLQAVLLALVGGGILGGLTANAWFGLMVGAAAGGLGLCLLPRWQRLRFTEQVRAELQPALGQLAVSLRSGLSLVSALAEWPRAIAQTVDTRRSALHPEVQRLAGDLARGATPDEALDALAGRLRLEEVRMLALVVRLSRRQGGDLGQVVAQTAQVIESALEVKSQVRTLTAGKRAEGMVVTLLPPAMLLLLTLENPSYMAPLIHTGPGRFILAVVLLLEAAAILFGRWLMQVEL